LLGKLAWNLDQFEGYVGVNNHMGSRFTQDAEGLRVVMTELKRRRLFFLDSLTTPKSIGLRVARDVGLTSAARDVFLDHDDDAKMIERQLARLERKARKLGVAIAIGHPRDRTLAALEAWLPTLAQKGISLIPASEAVYLLTPAEIANNGVTSGD